MASNNNNINNNVVHDGEEEEETPQPPPPQPLPIPMWLMEHCQRLEANLEDFTNLNLNIRQLNPNMMSSLCTSLTKNYTILTLNMVSTFSTQPYPNKCLLEFSQQVLATPSSSQLQKLHLSYNRLTSIDSIGLALKTNTTLTELYLDYNNVNSESVKAIANGLKENKTLEVLKLSSNRINDDGGQALGHALNKNRTLKTLSLSRNPNLGSLTGQAFIDAFVVNNNTSLTILDIREGNNGIPNSIQLEYYANANRLGRYLIHCNDTHTHQTRNSHHDVPLGIWPLVLEKPPQHLQPSIGHMFLKERPDLVQVAVSTTTTTTTTNSG